MEQEIKNILANYSYDKQYFDKIANIKKIIDEEYQKYYEFKENKKINDNIIKLIESTKWSKNEIEELKKLKIKKNFKKSYENIAGQNIDLRYTYDIYKNKYCYTINLDIYGYKDDDKLNFWYEEFENEIAIINLFEDLKFKKISIQNFVQYILYILKNDYEYEIYDYLFSNIDDEYEEYKKAKQKEIALKDKKKKEIKNYNKNINKDIQDFFN